MKTFMKLIFLVSMFLYFTYAQNTGVFLTIKPQNVTTTPGRQIDLKCVFSGATPSPCYWSQNNRNFMPDGVEFVFSGNNSKGNCSLKIPNAKLEHDGLYRCGFMTIGPQKGIISDPPAKVTILHKPNYPQIKYKGLVVDDGEIRVPKSDPSISVHCISREGNPTATVAWMSNNSTTEFQETKTITDSNISPLQTMTNELSMPNSEDVHHSRFNCNIIHESYNSCSITLDIFIILEGPVTTTTILLSNSTEAHLESMPGQPIEMNCTAHAEPKPNYVWEKKNSATAEWVIFGNEGQVQTIKDGGIYRCGAKNGFNGLEYIYSSEFQVTEQYVEEGETLHAGAIAGIVLGVIFICFLVALLTYLACKKKKLCFKGKTKRNNQKDATKNNSEAEVDQLNKPNQSL